MMPLIFSWRVLNAFRHHGVSRKAVDELPKLLACVLNAFRHHGVSRAHSSEQKHRAEWVLNAFRHHGVSRSTVPRKKPTVEPMCSTPFGITEFRGIISRGNKRCLTSAQRLSASRSFAVGLQRLGQQLGLVLNAFRHHGVSRPGNSCGLASSLACSTPFGITEFRGRGLERHPSNCLRAQRLSASRSFAEMRWPSRKDHSCRAQRLSASRSFADLRGVLP